MIISLSGQAGSGKTTVGKLLAKKLHYKFYDIGALRKKMAKDRGISIEEFNKLGEKESFTDKDADAHLVKIAKTMDNVVVQGRVAYYFIPQSIKVYLKISADEAAKRIMNDKDNPKRNSQAKSSSLETIKKISMQRDRSDVLRYRKWYGIENFADPKNYDLIIDTTKINAREVVKKMMKYVKSIKQTF